MITITIVVTKKVLLLFKHVATMNDTAKLQCSNALHSLKHQV